MSVNPDLNFSIIIRAYNEERHIGRLLEGILKQNVEPAKIVLVDSGSTDATLSIASRYPVELIQISPEDFTFGYFKGIIFNGFEIPERFLEMFDLEYGL